jgi:hypothetical protein
MVVIPIKSVEGVNTLNQNIININKHICPSFELIVLKKRYVN